MRKRFISFFFVSFFPLLGCNSLVKAEMILDQERDGFFERGKKKIFGGKKRGVPSKKVKTDQFQFLTLQKPHSERTLRKATTTTRTRTTKTTTSKKKKKSNTSSTKTATSSRNTFQLSSSTRTTSSKSRSCTLR